MGLLVGWEVEVFVGTCNSVCRMDARRPWPVTVVVDIVHGAVLYKTFFCQADVDVPLSPYRFLLGIHASRLPVSPARVTRR
jgi:hypothetical protein